MARARLIKPGFFTSDELGHLSPHARLLFAGLWCIADRAGRLEDRPERIKTEILPYDRVVVVRLLTALHDAGFIQRYTVRGKAYILIPGFLKHQSPHIREPVSVIPPPVQAPVEHGAGPVLSTSMAPVEPESCTDLAPVEARLTRALSDPDLVIDPDPLSGDGNREPGASPRLLDVALSSKVSGQVPGRDERVSQAIAGFNRFNIKVVGTQAERVFACLDDGAEPAWFEEAGRIAAGSGRGSFAYAIAIIENWIPEGGPPPKPERGPTRPANGNGRAPTADEAAWAARVAKHEAIP